MYVLRYSTIAEAPASLCCALGAVHAGNHTWLMLFVSFWSSVSMLCSLWTTPCWLCPHPNCLGLENWMIEASIGITSTRCIRELKLWWVISHQSCCVDAAPVSGGKASKYFETALFTSPGGALFPWQSCCSARHNSQSLHRWKLLSHGLLEWQEVISIGRSKYRHQKTWG